MQALKALVIFMGILIVVGAGVVAMTLYQRLTGGVEETASPTVATGPKSTATGPVATAATALPTRPKPFGTREIPVAAGARVEGMVAEGGRLILRLGQDRGGQRIVVVDLTDGTVLGTLDLVPKP